MVDVLAHPCADGRVSRAGALALASITRIHSASVSATRSSD
jgi:hypothetical protein